MGSPQNEQNDNVGAQKYQTALAQHLQYEVKVESHCCLVRMPKVTIW